MAAASRDSEGELSIHSKSAYGVRYAAMGTIWNFPGPPGTSQGRLELPRASWKVPRASWNSAPKQTETDTQGYTRVHRDTQGYTGIHRDAQGYKGYTGIHRDKQEVQSLVFVLF